MTCERHGGNAGSIMCRECDLETIERDAMTTPNDLGHACSPTQDCTAHNLHCGYPECAKGRREGVHARPMTTPTPTPTPTPRTDALTKRMAGELDRPMLQQNHFIELCDHSRQLERDLAAAQEARQAAEADAEQNAKDAERLEWLISRCTEADIVAGLGWLAFGHGSIRAGIDAAIAEGPKHG